jgi:hypothetical protein
MLNDERSKTTTTKKIVWLMFMTTLGTRPAGPQAADQGEVVGETWDAQTGVEFLIITLLHLILIIIF